MNNEELSQVTELAVRRTEEIYRSGSVPLIDIIKEQLSIAKKELFNKED